MLHICCARCSWDGRTCRFHNWLCRMCANADRPGPLASSLRWHFLPVNVFLLQFRFKVIFDQEDFLRARKKGFLLGLHRREHSKSGGEPVGLPVFVRLRKRRKLHKKIRKLCQWLSWSSDLSWNYPTNSSWIEPFFSFGFEKSFRALFLSSARKSPKSFLATFSGKKKKKEVRVLCGNRRCALAASDESEWTGAGAGGVYVLL